MNSLTFFPLLIATTFLISSAHSAEYVRYSSYRGSDCSVDGVIEQIYYTSSVCLNENGKWIIRTCNDLEILTKECTDNTCNDCTVVNRYHDSCNNTVNPGYSSIYHCVYSAPSIPDANTAIFTYNEHPENCSGELTAKHVIHRLDQCFAGSFRGNLNSNFTKFNCHGPNITISECQTSDCDPSYCVEREPFPTRHCVNGARSLCASAISEKIAVSEIPEEESSSATVGSNSHLSLFSSVVLLTLNAVLN